jgi:ABC-type nitrate/sulfonate/bicarbonate transport system ATPase subunit
VSALLDIARVSKAFPLDGGSVAALSRVSLTVEEGAFVSLVGPSGCGKSTLLRLVAGLEAPDDGTVSMDGRAIAGAGLERGIVFQDHRLFPWLTVEENIRLGLHKSGLSPSGQRDRATELIRLVGLDGFASAKPQQLSGGMAQRAAIARSLAPKPRILLLDEPLGALDSLTRSQMQAELLRVWQAQGITMLMVTHDAEEAVFLSDRIVVMGARPGTIRRVIDVTLPRPRRRADPDAVRLREDVLAAIETA